MEYEEKLVYQSNYWYNDGLKRAKIRDLSGAVTALKKSLQYNRENIAARNLLGLVYYGRGEMGEALVEWIISKNLKSHENIAGYYIQKLQENPAEFKTVNQAIQKYNQSLAYCQQNGEDLAIIQLKKVIAMHDSFLKGYQLLALLYIHTEQYAQAKAMLKEARRLDATSDLTLRYTHELNQIRRRRVIRPKKEEKSQTVTYSIGNETIIQPATAGIKDNAGLMTFINIVIGIFVGVAFMWFLVMPAVNKSAADRRNRQVLDFSDKIAASEAQISALKKELEGYRAASEEAQSVKETAASTLESYETVLNIYGHYAAEDMSDADMAENLIRVKPNALGVIGRGEYDEMTEEIYGRYGKVLYADARESFDAADYERAVSSLSTLMKMNEGFADGEAMYLLAQSYKAQGDGKNAKLWEEKVKKKFPNLLKEKEGR